MWDQREALRFCILPVIPSEAEGSPARKRREVIHDPEAQRREPNSKARRKPGFSFKRSRNSQPLLLNG